MYGGGDDPGNYQDILKIMVAHSLVSEGHEVDAANLAMNLWWLRKMM
jgi:hypothetical protein